MLRPGSPNPLQIQEIVLQNQGLRKSQLLPSCYRRYQRSVAIRQPILPFPRIPFALYGSALRTSGSTSDAHNVLESANKKYPTDPIIGNNYANLLIDLGSFDQSIDLQSFISQNPPPPNLSDLKTNYDRAVQARALKASSPKQRPIISLLSAIL